MHIFFIFFKDLSYIYSTISISHWSEKKIQKHLSQTIHFVSDFCIRIGASFLLWVFFFIIFLFTKLLKKNIFSVKFKMQRITQHNTEYLNIRVSIVVLDGRPYTGVPWKIKTYWLNVDVISMKTCKKKPSERSIKIIFFFA